MVSEATRATLLHRQTPMKFMPSVFFLIVYFFRPFPSPPCLFFFPILPWTHLRSLFLLLNISSRSQCLVRFNRSFWNQVWTTILCTYYFFIPAMKFRFRRWCYIGMCVAIVAHWRLPNLMHAHKHTQTRYALSMFSSTYTLSIQCAKDVWNHVIDERQRWRCCTAQCTLATGIRRHPNAFTFTPNSYIASQCELTAVAALRSPWWH